MDIFNTKIFALFLVTSNFTILYAKADQDLILSQEVIKRSVVSSGDDTRLYRVFEKAKRGEPVTISVIGGSITGGAVTSSADCKWANRVAKWWRDSFPLVKVWTFVNAGLGATGSGIASHRATNDLIRYNPDLVVVEFSVNDFGYPDANETMEGLLRQTLKMPNSPAVMLLFTMFKNGTNCQDIHAVVGKHYELPMISYRDALWPEIQAGRLKWQEIAADNVHPNDTGHKYCAELINAFLSQKLSKMPDNCGILEIKPLPKAITSDLYEHTLILNYDNAMPVTNEGWRMLDEGPFGRGWVSETPGSIIEFNVEASVVAMSSWRIKRDMGIAEVQLDQQAPIKMNAHFNETWGGYNVWQPVGKSTERQKHSVRIKLLDETDPNSNGHRFEIRALLLAGVEG